MDAVRPHRLAIELRNRRWVDEERAHETLGWFSEHDVAFVCVDAPPGDATPIMPPIDAVTRDDLAYVRIHGRNVDGYLHGQSVAERFGWIYGDEELEEVASRARGLAEQADEVHVFFNNNRDDDAPTAARRFRSLLGQDPGPPPRRTSSSSSELGRPLQTLLAVRGVRRQPDAGEAVAAYPRPRPGVARQLAGPACSGWAARDGSWRGFSLRAGSSPTAEGPKIAGAYSTACRSGGGAARGSAYARLMSNQTRW